MDEQTFPEAADSFAFGKNWAAFAATISKAQIDEAQKALESLLGLSSLKGLSFLDIGSGSGLHSLSALRLGAGKIVAFYVDEDSASTTSAVLERHAPPGSQYEVRRDSILSTDLSISDKFDIVYSWGVLHHTGHMHQSIRNAAYFVKPGGILAVALYRKTMLCGLWKIEKRIYSQAPGWLQYLIRASYISLFRVALLATGRSFSQYVAEYPKKRGMDFFHDVHDWLGGWPYESISPSDMRQIVIPLGFSEVRSKTKRYSLGVFGSGCDEYVFRRTG